MPCTTPPRGGTTKKKADHPEPAINSHRDLPRQHPSALHLPRLPEPPTRDLTYTRNARASTLPRSIGFCVIWDCTSSSSSELAFYAVIVEWLFNSSRGCSRSLGMKLRRNLQLYLVI